LLEAVCSMPLDRACQIAMKRKAAAESNDSCF
jgi:hypothetical protein